LFNEVPEAVQNTLEVAEKCNLEIEFGKLHYPVFHPPEHFTREGYLRQFLAEGLRRRYGIHARAEGKEFIVERVEDPRRLPTYDVGQVSSLSRLSGHMSAVGAEAEGDRLEACPTLQNAAVAEAQVCGEPNNGSKLSPLPGGEVRVRANQSTIPPLPTPSGPSWTASSSNSKSSRKPASSATF